MGFRTRLLVVLSAVFVGALAGVCASSVAGFELPRATTPPKEIWTINQWELSEHELTTFVSLQGQIARKGGSEQLYLIFRVGKSYSYFLDLLESDHGVKVNRDFRVWDIFKRLSIHAAGYVLYDRENPDSLQVATMMASIHGAALVEAQHEAQMVALTGWKKLGDGSSVTLEAYLEKPLPGLNLSSAAQQDPRLGDKLRDYLVMAGMPVAYDRPFPAWITPDPPVAARPLFGWGNTEEKGESPVITAFGNEGYYLIPTSGAENLSVLSAFGLSVPLVQAGAAAQPVMEDDTHLVSFVFTDGDNLSFVLKSMATDKRFFGSPLRGQIPAAFATAPAIADLAPVAQKWYYQTSAGDSEKTYFLAGPSGLGYIYPSRFPSNLLEDFTRRTAQAMGKLDLKYIQVIDFDAFDRADLWESFLQYDEIEGLLLNDYAPYHKYAGQLAWVNEKPVASARYCLWEGLAHSSNDEVAAALNSGDRDLTQASGYSFVMVHVWSRNYDDVQAVIDQLDPHVKVVTPDVMFETMKARVQRGN